MRKTILALVLFSTVFFARTVQAEAHIDTEDAPFTRKLEQR
jgi:hypothetical protein